MTNSEFELDRIADEFEAAWQSGQRPDVAAFLQRVDENRRERLAGFLIPLDIEYRQRKGEPVTATDYAPLGYNCEQIGERSLARSELQGLSDILAPTIDVGQLNRENDQEDLFNAGDWIGPYQLHKPIGEGGMGEVWIADQSEPVNRRVALKLIRADKVSRDYIARFEAERRALAMMNHPNIARFLDAGTWHPDKGVATLLPEPAEGNDIQKSSGKAFRGQPFFVKEYVPGKPLTEYCDENRLSIDERLRLFMDVCAGVQHAHQKGIIHRDLKPGNILVEVIDDKPVAKVIDFGLAKAMENAQQLTDGTMLSMVGQVIGTLKYMSPEQASLDNLDIDTRTDIYALGVILYELLTGSTPLDDSSIRGQAPLKILEFIRDKEPVKPSSRLLGSSDEQKSSITSLRRTDAVRLNRVLAGDLDWIVLKALEKDRSRRYESASGFAADIGRYLNSEPVTARPPSLNYRVEKFVRKNRAGVIAASLVGLSLIGGIISTSLAMQEAWRQTSIAQKETMEKEFARTAEKKQREYAESETKEKEAALKLETISRELADKRAKQLEQVVDFQSEQFETMDPQAVGARLRELLVQELKRERAGKNVASKIPTDMEQRLFDFVSNANFTNLGMETIGYEVLEKSVDAAIGQFSDQPEILHQLLQSVADRLRTMGLPQMASKGQEVALEIASKSFGELDTRTIDSRLGQAMLFRDINLLDQAKDQLQQTFELCRARRGPTDYWTIVALNGLAETELLLGNETEAEDLFLEAHRLTSKYGNYSAC